MDIAALVTWIVTALGGFVLLGTWISRGGPRSGTSRLPAPVVFGHFALAAAGLVVWIIYLAARAAALAWTAFGLLVPVALLGFAMFARWIPVRRSHAAVPGRGPEPAERHFPVPVVVAHGLFAVATVVLVLLTALGAGAAPA
ncbi:hypothetical protein [Microbispora sp. NPDC046933]|uniref:hypothetical protein n=1 Tax=Microbispora sp. NPDC046933 TaxID=3155618 RepID=UPI0033C38D9F